MASFLCLLRVRFHRLARRTCKVANRAHWDSGQVALRNPKEPVQDVGINVVVV